MEENISRQFCLTCSLFFLLGLISLPCAHAETEQQNWTGPLEETTPSLTPKTEKPTVHALPLGVPLRIKLLGRGEFPADGKTHLASFEVTNNVLDAHGEVAYTAGAHLQAYASASTGKAAVSFQPKEITLFQSGSAPQVSQVMGSILGAEGQFWIEGDVLVKEGEGSHSFLRPLAKNETVKTACRKAACAVKAKPETILNLEISWLTTTH